MNVVMDLFFKTESWESISLKISRGFYPSHQEMKRIVKNKRLEIVNQILEKNLIMLLRTGYNESTAWILENTKISPSMFPFKIKYECERQDLILYPNQKCKEILFFKRLEINEKAILLEKVDFDYPHYTLLNVFFNVTYFNLKKEIYELKKNYNNIAEKFGASLLQ